MPAPTLITATFEPADKFHAFEQGDPKWWPQGAVATFGLLEGGGALLHKIEFEAAKWDEEKVRTWLRDTMYFDPDDETFPEVNTRTDSADDKKRFDRAPESELIRFDRARVSKWVTTPQGYKRADARITRAGVLRYRTPDGGVRCELRPPDEVFKQDSLDTLRLAPVTDDHPGMLNAENTRQYLRGNVGEDVRRDGLFVGGQIQVTDAELIKKIASGKQEISAGYAIGRLDEQPGMYDPETGEYGPHVTKGEKYDAIQRSITYNHVAVVEAGRAGPDCRLRLDSGAAVMDYAIEDSQNKETGMKTITIDGESFEVQDAIAKRLDSLEKEVAATSKKASEQEARADSLQEKLEAEDKEEKQRQDAEAIRKAVRERIDLESVAGQVCSKDVLEKLDSLSDIDLKREVIRADSPKADLSDKDDVYIAARYDAVVETLGEKGKGGTGVTTPKVATTETGGSTRSDDDDLTPSQKARMDMIERNRKLSEKGLDD